MKVYFHHNIWTSQKY